MRRHRFSPSLQSLKGFSLIELIVSVAIGLIITIAAFSAYLGASTASRIADAQERMNEDAQAALTILTQQLRMVGNNPNQSDRTDKSRRNPVYNPYDSTIFVNNPPAALPSSFSIRGCSEKFNNIKTSNSLDNLLCLDGKKSSPDSIAVSYEADAFNSVPTTSGLPTDCLGVALDRIEVTFPAESPPGPYPYSVADNRFYIDSSAANVPSLYCKGNGKNGTPQPLVENIEDLQFNYGTVKASTIATELKTTSVGGYLRADEITTNAAMAALPNDSARWAKVITVRICILVRSETNVVSDSASARYLKCDGTIENSPPDLRLRHAYSALVVLRNRRL